MAKRGTFKDAVLNKLTSSVISENTFTKVLAENKISIKDELRPLRFYDNEPHNIESMQKEAPEIYSVLVEHNTPNELIASEYNSGNKDVNLYPINFLKSMPKTVSLTYANIVQDNGGETTLPCVGLSVQHIADIIKWAMNQSIENKTIYFDWDRTLSVVEGILSLDIVLKNVTAEDTLFYLVGGLKRFINLQNMFTTLKDNSVKVIILTNNASAKQTNVNYDGFLKILKILIPFINPTKNQIIYAGEDRNKNSARSSTKNAHGGKGKRQTKVKSTK